jgi:hypothetical protein
VYSGQVCAGAGSFGGDSYAGGVIYMPCTNGVQALSYNAVSRSFTPLWQGPKDAFGPPIVSAGLVWDVASGGFSGGGTKLYGLDPASGAVRYTETLPSPVADHFASPSAGGGRVLVSTGSTVSAFQVGTVIPSAPGIVGPGGTAIPLGSVARPKSTLGVLVKTKLHADRKGRVRVVLRCPPAVSTCRGAVGLAALLTVHVGHGRHRHRSILRVRLAHTSFGARHGQFSLTLRLGEKARALLHRHHGKLRVSVTIALANVSTHRVAASLSG